MSPGKLHTTKGSLYAENNAATLSQNIARVNRDDLHVFEKTDSLPTDQLKVFGSLSPSPELRHYTNPNIDRKREKTQNSPKKDDDEAPTQKLSLVNQSLSSSKGTANVVEQINI